jgi:soluble lytic murein transglycosylase-like protein
MDYASIASVVAKKVGVPYFLLLAICTHESGGLKNIKLDNDMGTPSYGVCMVKSGTAQMFGYKGTEKELMIPKINFTVAAKYLKYQLDRYDNNWCKATAAYNSGTYFESKKKPGQPIPISLQYIGRVKGEIVYEYSWMLDCKGDIVINNGH